MVLFTVGLALLIASWIWVEFFGCEEKRHSRIARGRKQQTGGVQAQRGR